MIRLVVLVALVLMFANVGGQGLGSCDSYPEQYYRPNSVRGDFKSVSEYEIRYYFRYGMIRIRPRKNYSYFFNTLGQKIYNAAYLWDGAVEYSEFIRYDSVGNEVYDGFAGKYEYSYDNHKRVTEKIRSSGIFQTSKVTYKYNSAGLMIEEASYGLSRKDKKTLELRSMYRYKYDKNKHLIEKVGNEYSGIYKGTAVSYKYPTSRIVYTYNQAGNLIEEISFVGKSHVTEKITYRYDDKNNMVEKILSSGNGRAFWKVQYKYDEYGNVIELMNRYADNTPYSKYIYLYSK